MAFRIAHVIERGELDNTRCGRVVGTLHLLGCDDVVTLDLKGNCLPDLAGRTCSFVNPAPGRGRGLRPGELAAVQKGIVGEMTASRKVRIPGDDFGENAGEFRGNCLYLEWYSESNGRVVIESTDFTVTVSLPEWTMEAEEAEVQAEANQEAFGLWLSRLREALDPGTSLQVPSDRLMDEFEWERFMREADACGERYGELLDKYRDHPERDRIIAREMGWPQLEQVLDDLGAGRFDDVPDLPMELLAQEAADALPDPEREGIDWVPDGQGGYCHPIVWKARNVVDKMFEAAERAGLRGNADQETDGDADVIEMIFQTRSATVKLAGALNGVANGLGPIEPGFVIASLKRTLLPLTAALNALGRLQDRGVNTIDHAAFRHELFHIRDAILDLQQKYRDELNLDDLS